MEVEICYKLKQTLLTDVKLQFHTSSVQLGAIIEKSTL